MDICVCKFTSFIQLFTRYIKSTIRSIITSERKKKKNNFNITYENTCDTTTAYLKIIKYYQPRNIGRKKDPRVESIHPLINGTL